MLRTLSLSLIVALFALAVGACADVGPGTPGSTGTVSAAATATGRFIVKFTNRDRGMAALHAAGASVALDLPSHGAAAAYIPAPALKGLQNNPNIEYIEEDAIRKPLGQVTPYGITMVQADDATFNVTPPNSVRVCIIDSGFYGEHEDLAGIPVDGYNGNLPWNVDGCGHGSHVAGTITAADNDVGVVGVAPGAVDLYIVRVFGDDCSWAYSSDLVDALSKCEAAGAKVVSMSLGGGQKVRTEDQAFKAAYASGILSIAAAGNDGNTRMSYPASYSSVVSVAAIDINEVVADFSQQNSQVELAAPGVAVKSTVPWTNPTLTVAGVKYDAALIELAPQGHVTGALANGGLCDAANPDWAGKIVLCERGLVSFYDKVHNVQLGGGAAAIIYNSDPGNFAGTLGDGNTATIPAISLSQEDGQYLVASQLGAAGDLVAQVVKPGSGYEEWDGTSMATPHVSGVAALVWSYFPEKSNTEIRDALTATAKDLGAAGRDNAYGFGLVQAKAAYDYLNGTGGGGGGGTGGSCLPKGSACASGSECCSGNCFWKTGVCK